MAILAAGDHPPPRFFLVAGGAHVYAANFSTSILKE
jgi:hypothetical protein